MPTDTKLNNLVINYLTQEQYDAIATKNENELYLTPDEGGGGIQTIGATESLDETDGSLKLTMDSAPSGEMFILSFGEDSALVNALMVRDVYGDYYGCSSGGDTTTYFYIFISADGTGSAFGYYAGFLYSQKRQTDGKVLTIQGNRAQWEDLGTTYSKARYKHVVNLSFEEAGVKKLSAMFTGYNSSSEPVTTYEKLTKLFGGETLELHGKVIVDGTVRDTKYLDLHGGGINTDNIAYYVGTGNDPLSLVTINLDQFNGLTIADDWCLPK